MGQNKYFDVEEDGDEYTFPGSDELKKIAEDELRETDSLRATSLKQLRECIRKHPDIKKCRTGNENDDDYAFTGRRWRQRQRQQQTNFIFFLFFQILLSC